MNITQDRPGVIERYRAYLPVNENTPVVSLSEGSTPLIFSPRLSEKLNSQVWLKYEGLNPTASFKDRGMTVAVSKAKEEGAEVVICASTGNTSASAAAYAARAGVQCAVLLPAGKIARGKLMQAYAYGARVIGIAGNFDAALDMVRTLGEHEKIKIVNSVNPVRLQGQKTAAFEVIDALGDAPDLHVLPVGNAGNITAYWMGYEEFYKLGRSSKLPPMLGFQAAGAAPLYYQQIVAEPDTCATAIRIGNPASWDGAMRATGDSQGLFDIVTDEEILAAQRWLASAEGIYVEPASAAPVAGLLKCCSEKSCEMCPTKKLPPGSKVVVTLTGHGLKDPESAQAMLPEQMETVAPDPGALLKLLQV
ncbi:MAG: threonine synthase [Verrucomicrobiales bacterium]